MTAPLDPTERAQAPGGMSDITEHPDPSQIVAMLRDGGPSIPLTSETFRQSPSDWYRPFFDATADLIESQAADLSRLREERDALRARVGDQTSRFEAAAERGLATRRAVREAVTPLVVAVDRYIDRSAESDEAARHDLWRAMASSSSDIADAFGVYPLRSDLPPVAPSPDTEGAAS